jgi:hypothetical protein
MCLLLAAAAPSARANGLGNALGHAIINKVTGGHDLHFNSPLDGHKLFVIIPEPNSGVLLALGGLVGLAAWRLRNRKAQNKISSARQ